jgi:hypothetical protein
MSFQVLADTGLGVAVGAAVLAVLRWLVPLVWSDVCSRIAEEGARAGRVCRASGGGKPLNGRRKPSSKGARRAR